MAPRAILALKFGGTSMANRECIARVMEIIRQQRKHAQIITVVSAMAGVTDALLGIGQSSSNCKTSVIDSRLQQLRQLHEDNFKALTVSPASHSWIERTLDRHFAEIRSIAQGISLLREFSDRTREKLLSYGEILSSSLLARVLRDQDPTFCHSDARDWLVAEWTPQGSVVDMEETERRVRDKLLPCLTQDLSPIVPGFICRTPAGESATLGRNGSDYSAAIIGAVLRAREIWIYTDVDGILTADPNLVSEATILKQVSYQEAAEMSYLGAKVVHPKTMIPAVLHSVPIRIKNTFNPACPGTLITGHSARGALVKTVTSARDLVLLNVQGNGIVAVPRVMSRIFDVMARENIGVMMVSQSSSEHSICFVIQARDADRAYQALNEEFRYELDRNLVEGIEITPRVALVSVVGAGMRGRPGTSGKFFDALGRCRINVLAIAQGSSELNISAAIPEKDYRHAVRAIHTAFGLTRDLHIFIFGCGNIGRMLIKQIHDNRKQLARTLQVNLKVFGVANSRTLRFSSAGLTPAELEALGTGRPLEGLPGAEPRPDSSEIFERIAAAYRSDVALVDATAADLGPTHMEGLRRGFHVVTANKKPLTTTMEDYSEIQRLRRHKGLSYHYEATFGAGLPLLSTLQDLINTGDRVLRVQGCLSGTLGLICSGMDEGRPFSSILEEAMQKGFTEPDPRDDLAGTDVARKALIIARELGLQMEQSDIRLQPLLERKFFKLKSVKEFLGNLPAADASMLGMAQKALAGDKALRYVADIVPGNGCEVGLKHVPKNGPIGRLAGPDNILVFHTQRYFEHPLVIQGPGAGASVTAAGVLSDLLKIAKRI